jgi:TolA-binding protein
VLLQVGVRRVGSASLAGLLMTGVATAALAAKAPDPREARMEQLEAEIQQLKSDNQRLHQEGDALRDRADRLQGEVEELKQDQATQTSEIKTQQDRVQTVEAKIPPPPSVIDDMLNGRPVFTSANGRFTLTLHTVMQLDTAAYF